MSLLQLVRKPRRFCCLLLRLLDVWYQSEQRQHLKKLCKQQRDSTCCITSLTIIKKPNRTNAPCVLMNVYVCVCMCVCACVCVCVCVCVVCVYVCFSMCGWVYVSLVCVCVCVCACTNCSTHRDPRVNPGGVVIGLVSRYTPKK